MKKQIKRLLSLVIAGMLIISITPISVQANEINDLTKDITKVTDITGISLEQAKTTIAKDFKDFSATEWYADYIAKLVGIGGIMGYPDKTMRINGTITKAEFLKVLVASIYGEQADSGTHWAGGYIKKAETVGILSSGEVSGRALDTAITRQEMAKFITLAMEKGLNEARATNIEDIKRIITDKASIGYAYTEYVYNAYGKGIITGYPDKSFGPTKTATRAEASTMLVRMLDANERDIPGDIKWEVITVNGWVLPEENYEHGTDDGIIYYEVREPGGTLIELVIRISAGTREKRSLIDQWAASEMALKSKLDVSTVKNVMDYVKTKTNSQTTFLADENFDTSKYYVLVEDDGGNVYINVWSK